MADEINLKEFIKGLENRTQNGAVVLKSKGKPVAVLMSFDDYLDLLNNVTPKL